MRVSVIVTVKNEERAIGQLLDSLLAQSRMPDEVVVVDGGSSDSTARIIRDYANRGAPIKLLLRPGASISMGRNAAIAAANGEVIAATDAGVRLEPDWLEQIVVPFFSTESGQGGVGSAVEVASGFFVADPRSVFETALGATVLPSLAEVDPARFLPSSRSVAFRKSAWSAVGGYPEWLDYCEDLVFDLALRRAGFRFQFAPRALVHFRPRRSLQSFFMQYFRYARGDGKALLWTKRHIVRYSAFAVGLLTFRLGTRHRLVWLALLPLVAGYVANPYRRLAPYLPGMSVKQGTEAVALVPLLRLTGDVAKMLGYPFGLCWRLSRRTRDA